MRCAIICFRPYQLFSAINMVLNNTEETAGNTDLFLLDLPILKELEKKLKKKNIFKNVYYFSEVEDRGPIKRKMYKFKNLIMPRKSIFEHICDKKPISIEYDKVMSAGWINFFFWMCSVNKKAEVIMLDDGTASMTMGDFRTYEFSSLFLFFSRVTGLGPMSIEISRLYLNETRLLEKKTIFPVLNMPTPSLYVLKTIKNIFGYYGSHQYKNKRLVFLTRDLPTNCAELMLDVIDLCKKFSEDIIIRKHPVQRHYLEELKGFEIDSDNELWELIAYEEVSNELILMGTFSTAQITPWSLYKKKPTLIFLQKLFEISNKTMDNCLKKMRKLGYENIFLPNSVKELEMVLINELTTL